MRVSFHPEGPLDSFPQRVAGTYETPQHTYQVLTKRSERLLELHHHLNWTSNIWMGVSVEDSRVMDRIDHLRYTNAKTKFLSCEPLIGSLENMNLEKIDWVIVGGESGRKARPMQEWWVWDIMQQCREAGVAFFFKQWGGVNKKKTGREFAGSTYNEKPLVHI